MRKCKLSATLTSLQRPTRILAAAALDAEGVCIAPAQALVRAADASRRAGAHAVELLSLTRAGSEDAQAALRAAGPLANTINAPDSVLTPGFVNAHTHLDLSRVPPIPFDASAGFMSFVRYVLASRLSTLPEIERAVAEGVRLSRAGGVVAVGDIAGVVQGAASPFATQALASTGMLGVSYIEFFGFGSVLPASVQALRAAFEHAQSSCRASATRVGLSPHAPYTASTEAYAAANALAKLHNLPQCTHLAENPEEREFVAFARGAYRELHEKLQWWEARTAKEVGQGLSPVQHFARSLAPTQEAVAPPTYLLAHVNDAGDEDIELLAKHNACVVYSPRSSRYFLNHQHFGPHRFQKMLDAGITVALGTDSVINLPPDTVHPTHGSLSTLDEARLLFDLCGTNPLTLLKMLTTNGAKALGLPKEWFTLGCDGRGSVDANAIVKAGLVLTPLAQSRLTSPAPDSFDAWARAFIEGGPTRLVNVQS
jgi:cytosine/adenosine deaminase-related metal-dependent hydrolase